MESYRNAAGRVCHRTVLNVGFLTEQLTAEQLNLIARILTDMYQKRAGLFPNTDPIIKRWVNDLWQRIVSLQRLDITLYDKDSRMVKDADSLPPQCQRNR